MQVLTAVSAVCAMLCTSLLGVLKRTGGCMRHEILPQVMRCEECRADRWIQVDIGQFGSADIVPAVDAAQPIWY